MGAEESESHMVLRMLEELMIYADDMFSVCEIVPRGDVSADGMSYATPIFTYVSPSTTKLLGWAPAQLIGRNKLELAHPDDAERLAAVMSSVHDGSMSCAYLLYRFLNARGTYSWLHTQMCSHEGLLLCIGRDANDFKNTEAALREFLLSTSHDLRTPCHGIMTASQLLASRVAADAEASFLVQAVRSGAGLMLGMISNILEMRFMCSGDGGGGAAGGGGAEKPPDVRRLNLKPVTFALRDLIAQTLQTCRLGCGLLRGKLLWSNESVPLPAAVLADVDRVGQILQNALLYMLHHSQGAAPVVFDVRCDYATAASGGSVPPGMQSGLLEMSVCDPERSLWTEECERVFSPNFTPTLARGNSAAAGSSSGLGLFVARTLARDMGGDVTAESVGHCGGMELRIRLPVVLVADPSADALAAASPSAAQLAAASAAYAAAGAGAGSPRAPKRPQGVVTTPRGGAPEAQRARRSPEQQPETSAELPPHCLLVDDHELNLRLVRRLLEKHGFEVTTAVNGLEALHLLQASLSGVSGAPRAPDIALVDVQMPSACTHCRAVVHCLTASGG